MPWVLCYMPVSYTHLDVYKRQDQWHVNPAQVAVLGFSSGGHLAANLATSVGDEDIREQGGIDPDLSLIHI